MQGVAGVVELWGGVLLELVAREEAGVEVIGGADKYMAVCRQCYFSPNKVVTPGPAIKNNDHRYVRQLNLVLRLVYERYFFIFTGSTLCSVFAPYLLHICSIFAPYCSIFAP